MYLRTHGVLHTLNVKSIGQFSINTKVTNKQKNKLLNSLENKKNPKKPWKSLVKCNNKSSKPNELKQMSYSWYVQLYSLLRTVDNTWIYSLLKLLKITYYVLTNKEFYQWCFVPDNIQPFQNWLWLFYRLTTFCPIFFTIYFLNINLKGFSNRLMLDFYLELDCLLSVIYVKFILKNVSLNREWNEIRKLNILMRFSVGKPIVLMREVVKNYFHYPSL